MFFTTPDEVAQRDFNCDVPGKKEAAAEEQKDEGETAPVVATAATAATAAAPKPAEAVV